jgi:hypothetical protein
MPRLKFLPVVTKEKFLAGHLRQMPAKMEAKVLSLG